MFLHSPQLVHPARLTAGTWEYGPPGKGKSSSKASFSGSMLNFRGVSSIRLSQIIHHINRNGQIFKRWNIHTLTVNHQVVLIKFRSFQSLKSGIAFPKRIHSSQKCPKMPRKKIPQLSGFTPRHLALEIVVTFTAKTQNWNHEPHLRGPRSCWWSKKHGKHYATIWYIFCDLSYRIEMIVGIGSWPRNKNMGMAMKVNRINVI